MSLSKQIKTTTIKLYSDSNKSIQFSHLSELPFALPLHWG